MSEAWEDLGYAHKPKPRPVAAIEGVSYVDGRYEATVRRASGKRVWLYRSTEREARAAALEEVRR